MQNDRRHLASPVLALAFVAGAAIAAIAGPAHSATYTVTTLADNVTVDTQCSLREAVTAHNTAAGSNDCGAFDAAADTIDFSVNGTILLNSGLGELTIAAPALSLDGPGASLLVLDAQDAMSVLVLDPVQPAQLTVRSLTLQNGLSLLPAATPRGGGIRGFQGIGPSLTIEDSSLLDNVAQSTVFTSSRGGAIEHSGALIIRRTQIARNSADQGGAIYNVGTLTIEESELAQNSSQQFGGAIFSSPTLGPLTIERSLFRGNSTSVSGATLEIRSINYVATIENSTFRGNSTFNGSVLLAGTDGADIRLRNSTLADNLVTGPATEGVVHLLGGSLASPTQLTLTSTLFANNATPALSDAGAAGTTVLTATFNLFDTAAANLPPGTVCAGSTAGGANLCGIAAPGLNPLASNGGPTQTMSLQGASPAVNMGSNPGALATDQRGPGFPRTQGPQTDIGAFESAFVPVELLDFAVE